jgi:hypothetical protein
VFPFLIYVIACPLIALLCERIEKKLSIIIGFTLTTLSLFLTGPSELLHIPE